MEINKEQKAILKEIYKRLGYSEYYIDHPDEITDFHGKDLQEACLISYEFGVEKSKGTGEKDEGI